MGMQEFKDVFINTMEKAIDWGLALRIGDNVD